MTRQEVAFERGDTMIEFVRVVAEAATRKGWEIGFASAFAFLNRHDPKITRDEEDLSIAVGLGIARKMRSSLDVHWHPIGNAMMLVVSAGEESRDEPTQIVGVTQRTYESLDNLEISNEPIEEDDGGDLD